MDKVKFMWNTVTTLYPFDSKAKSEKIACFVNCCFKISKLCSRKIFLQINMNKLNMKKNLT